MSSDLQDSRISNPLDMDFAGWGDTENLDDIQPSQSKEVEYLDGEKKHFLGEWLATAICGNDITSSCLYVSALAIASLRKQSLLSNIFPWPNFLG